MGALFAGPTAYATPEQLLTRMVTPDDAEREWDDVISECALGISRPASTEPQSAAATHARSADIAATPATAATAGRRSAEPPRGADTETAAAASAATGCRSAEATHSQAPPSYPRRGRYFYFRYNKRYCNVGVTKVVCDP